VTGEENVTRRGFLKTSGWAIVGVSAAVLGVPLIAYYYPKKLEEIPAEPVAAGSLEDLPVGDSITIQYGRYPALVINTEDGLRAYSAVCTHFACLVKWDAELGQIVCPCHEGYFRVEDGSVISGPPPRELDAFPVTIGDDGLIYVGEEAGEETT
jgi:arsenite oxidase small subunit